MFAHLDISSRPIFTRFFSPTKVFAGIIVSALRDAVPSYLSDSRVETHLQKHPFCLHHQPCCAVHGRALGQPSSYRPNPRSPGEMSPLEVGIFQRISGSLEQSIPQRQYHPIRRGMTKSSESTHSTWQGEGKGKTLPGAQIQHYPRVLLSNLFDRLFWCYLSPHHNELAHIVHSTMTFSLNVEM